MAKPPGPFKKAWYEWKMLRFPWRKRWLVGFDLQGNTFWEFKDALHSLRNRRIAKYARSTHYGDVNVSPAWMQWLRHTRFDAPTLQEQTADLQRLHTIKLLAARADERWAAKPSALDSPQKQQPIQVLESRDPKSGVAQTNAAEEFKSRGLESRSAQTNAAEEFKSHGLESRSAQTRPEGRELSSVDDVSAVETPHEEPPFRAKKKLRANKPPKQDNPWKHPGTGNPGDDWQPKPWTPPPRRRG